MGTNMGTNMTPRARSVALPAQAASSIREAFAGEVHEWFRRMRSRRELALLSGRYLAQPRDSSYFVVRSTSDFQAGGLGAASNQTIEETQELLAESSGNLIYAGYPYDPYK